MSNDVALPTRRALASLWVLAAIGLGLLLVVARTTEGPLDDPDPAQQRPGYLDADGLPVTAPPLPAGFQSTRTVVVFFIRADQRDTLCRALDRSTLHDAADVLVVVNGPSDQCGRTMIVSDDDDRTARAFGMRSPRDHGPPVGYAVIDRHNQIRYRTLDPTLDVAEVRTIVEAVP